MKLSIQAGATSQTVNVFIQDSSSTTGAGLTGLVFNSSSLVAYYALPKAAAVQITLATLAAITTAWSSGGFKEVDATNMPGWYRLDIPDAALASGRFVSIHLKGATNMAPLPIEIELTATNNQSATAFITGINSLAPPTNWNLDSIDASGRRDVIKIAGTTQTARDIGASVLLSTGTGTGQLDFTSGVVKANATQLLGTAWLAPGVAGTPDVNAKLIGAVVPGSATIGTVTTTTTATNLTTNNDKTGYGLSAAAVQAIWDALTSALTTVGSIGKLIVTNLDAAISSRTKPADTQAAVTLVTTTTNLTNAPTAGDLTATMKASVTTAATAATPVAASVTGAVGSVAGNVGGNVVGSVGSVTAGVTLAAAAVTAIWAALTSALTTVGSVGKLLVDNIDAAISSRLATSGYTTPPTTAQNADKLLGRNLAGGSDGGRTVTDALRPSRNKVTVAAGVMTVYAEDDSTTAWTGALTTDATANPITAVDPT